MSTVKRVLYMVGDKVSLGILVPEDAERLAHWVNQAELRQFLSIYLPMSPGQEREWIENLPKRQPNDFVFAIVKNDDHHTHIGNIGLHRINYKDRRCSAGIFIGDQAERENGQGREVAKLLKIFAFDTLNLRKIQHEAIAANQRSIALAKSLGGIEEGVFKDHFYIDGKYHDVVSYAIFKSGLKPR